MGDLRLSNTQGSDRWYTKKPSQYENHNKGEIGVGQEVPSWDSKDSAIRQCLVLSIGKSFTRSRRARSGEIYESSALGEVTVGTYKNLFRPRTKTRVNLATGKKFPLGIRRTPQSDSVWFYSLGRVLRDLGVLGRGKLTRFRRTFQGEFYAISACSVGRNLRVFGTR